MHASHGRHTFFLNEWKHSLNIVRVYLEESLDLVLNQNLSKVAVKVIVFDNSEKE
jgi:hypothetical protein